MVLPSAASEVGPTAKQVAARPELVQSAEQGIAIPRARPSSYGAAVSKRAPRQDRSWAHFVAGGLGGMTAAFLTAPLDVLRTRFQGDYYQAQLVASRAARGIPAPSSLPFFRSGLLHFRETFQILFAIPRAEGWWAYFKGLGPNLVGVVPARAIIFYTYGNGKRLISDHFNDGRENAWVHLCAAAVSGVATGTATNPIWLVKTRLQLDRSHALMGATRQYRNALDCLMQTVRSEGVRGLYRGLSASYLGVAESTIQWVLYEQLKLLLRKREDRLRLSGRAATAWDHSVSASGLTVSAGVAKLVATVVTYPHEVIRTRLRQAPLADGRRKYFSIVQCFRTIVKEEGFVALYGGMTPHLLRVVPSAAIMFTVYEGVLRFLGTTSTVGT